MSPVVVIVSPTYNFFSTTAPPSKYKGAVVSVVLDGLVVSVSLNLLGMVRSPVTLIVFTNILFQYLVLEPKLYVVVASGIICVVISPLIAILSADESPSITAPFNVDVPEFVILPNEPLPVNIAVVPLNMVPSILPVTDAAPDSVNVAELMAPLAITLPMFILPEPP